MELTAALLTFSVMAIWRSLRRRRTNPFGRLPDVGDAPPEATPVASWRSSDDGLWTYWLDFSGGERETPRNGQPSS